MKNKNGKKKNNFSGKMILLLLACAFCGGMFCFIAPLLYFLSTYLLGFSISGLSLVLISGSISVMTLFMGIATKCIKITEEYEINTEEDSLIMRNQLYVVNGKQDKHEKEFIGEEPQLNSFYRFDNNYQDVDDEEIIDDLEDIEMSTGYDDKSRLRFKTRRRYKGKYL